MALQALEHKPLLAADAGFMYVAKMSGYADAYDLFTPDPGELAFLADEKAPHPFYTRGFLLAEEEDIPGLLARARQHGNCPSNLIIKGQADYIVCNGEIRATVTDPSVAAMECIGRYGRSGYGPGHGFSGRGPAPLPGGAFRRAGRASAGPALRAHPGHPGRGADRPPARGVASRTRGRFRAAERRVARPIAARNGICSKVKSQ